MKLNVRIIFEISTFLSSSQVEIDLLRTFMYQIKCLTAKLGQALLVIVKNPSQEVIDKHDNESVIHLTFAQA